MQTRPLTLSVDFTSGVLRVSGPVDEASIGLLREAVNLGSRNYTYDLVIELSDVDFLPSIGIGALVGAMRNAQEQGRSVHLVAATGTIVAKVLTISGVPHHTREELVEVDSHQDVRHS